MGEQVKIAELARELIRLFGLREEDIKIEYTGLRHGEKLSEDLQLGEEETEPTVHPKIRVVKSQQERASEIMRMVRQTLDDIEQVDDEEVRRRLKLLMPEADTRILVPEPETVKAYVKAAKGGQGAK